MTCALLKYGRMRNGPCMHLEQSYRQDIMQEDQSLHSKLYNMRLYVHSLNCHLIIILLIVCIILNFITNNSLFAPNN